MNIHKYAIHSSIHRLLIKIDSEHLVECLTNCTLSLVYSYLFHRDPIRSTEMEMKENIFYQIIIHSLLPCHVTVKANDEVIAKENILFQTPNKPRKFTTKRTKKLFFSKSKIEQPTSMKLVLR